jgi:hypothetical protein
MVTVDDGTGNGFKAGVNSENRVLTRAMQSTYQQHISCEHEEAYMCPLCSEATPTLTVTATGGYMLYLKNASSDYDAIISRITVSTSALITIIVMKNPTIGSLGNETAKIPVNKNFKSGKVSEIDCYSWDEAGDGITGITGGTCAGTYQVNGFERLLFDESICMGLNDVIALKAKGVGEIAVVMHGYYIVCGD